MATTIMTERTGAGATTVEHHRLMDRVFATADSWALFVARLGLGLVFLPHGLQKTLGWFGGHGFSGTMSFFQQMGIPAFFAFLAILAESLGSIGLITGFLARIAAFGIFCNMIVAILMVHVPNGFFMNWTGSQPGEGFEFHILAMTLALTVMIGGAGKGSIDRAIYRKAHMPSARSESPK